MTATEFAGLDFAVGTVTGVRSFSVDKLGRLTGVTFRKVWRPGENQAVCLAKHDDDYIVGHAATSVANIHRLMQEALGMATSLSVTIPAAAPPPPPKPKVLEHSFAECKCGFYAYYDGSNDYYDEARVTGVVEGYGETLIGTRGFRAMKARIVGLYLDPEDERGKFARVRLNYPDVPVFDTFAELTAAFPPDTSLVPTPDTDPDFWEREA